MAAPASKTMTYVEYLQLKTGRDSHSRRNCTDNRLHNDGQGHDYDQEKRPGHRDHRRHIHPQTTPTAPQLKGDVDRGQGTSERQKRASQHHNSGNRHAGQFPAAGRTSTVEGQHIVGSDSQDEHRQRSAKDHKKQLIQRTQGHAGKRYGTEERS